MCIDPEPYACYKRGKLLKQKNENIVKSFAPFLGGRIWQETSNMMHLVRMSRFLPKTSSRRLFGQLND